MDIPRESEPISSSYWDVVPSWLRTTWFPIYLLILPNSPTHFRECCVHLSKFILVTTGLSVVVWGGVALLVHSNSGTHAVRPEFLSGVSVIIFLLSMVALRIIQRTAELNPAGLRALAITIFAGLPAGILLNIADAYTNGASAIVWAAIDTAIGIFIFVRFFLRGVKFLPKQMAGAAG